MLHEGKHFVQKIIAMLLAILSVYVLIGWMFKSEMMVRIIPGSVAMGINTALLFLVASICIYPSLTKHNTLLKTIGAAILIIIPMLILYEHWYDIKLGLDWDALQSVIKDGNPRPGRTSPNACIAFILAGTCLIFLEQSSKNSRIRYTELILVWLTTSIGVLGLIGFFLELEALYQFAHYNRLAAPTAIGITLLGVGLWARLYYKHFNQDDFERGDKQIVRSAAIVLTIIAITSGLMGFTILKRVIEVALSDVFLRVTQTDANIIAATIDSKLIVANIITTRPSLYNYLLNFENNPGPKSSRDLIYKLQNYLTEFGVSGIRIISSRGKEITSVGTIVDNIAEMNIPLKGNSQTISLLWHNGFIIQVKTSIQSRGKEIGKVIVEQGMPALSSTMLDTTKSSVSTDILLCTRAKDDAVCFPSRFYKANLHIPMFKDGKPNLAISRALLGETGIMKVKDLRSINVIAGYTPIANTGLGMVLKSDISELYAIIRNRLQVFVGLLFGLVILGTLILRTKVQPLAKRAFNEREMFRVTLNSIADGVISTDSNGKITYINPIAVSMTGWTSEEAIGSSISKVLYILDDNSANTHRIDPEKATSLELTEINELANDKGKKSSEKILLQKNGKQFPIHLTVTKLQDEYGRVSGNLSVIEDITERKLAEEKLQNSEKTFRTAMEYASIGMALVKPSGQWLEINSALCEMMGYRKEDLIALSVQAITHVDDLKIDMDYIQQMLNDEIKSYQVEKRFYQSNGNIASVLLSVSLVRDIENKPDYFITQFQDITHKKEVERLKNDFISIISHELRTPLTAIKGSLGIIQGVFSKDCPLEVNNLIQIGLGNCERLILLISDLLDIDKMAAGEMRFDMQKASISDLTAQAVGAIESYAHTFGIKIHLQPIAEEIYVYIDPNRYIQAITNLMSNAIKFSVSEQVIEICISSDTQRVRIAVKDQGCGIPDVFKNRIFQKFSQADSVLTRAKSGTGLGLHITKSIVESMHGTIDFESIPGKGTTFWMQFPLYKRPNKRQN